MYLYRPDFYFSFFCLLVLIYLFFFVFFNVFCHFRRNHSNQYMFEYKKNEIMSKKFHMCPINTQSDVNLGIIIFSYSRIQICLNFSGFYHFRNHSNHDDKKVNKKMCKTSIWFFTHCQVSSTCPLYFSKFMSGLNF